MSPDIFAIKNLLKEDKIWNAAKHHMENYHNTQVSFSRKSRQKSEKKKSQPFRKTAKQAIKIIVFCRKPLL